MSPAPARCPAPPRRCAAVRARSASLTLALMLVLGAALSPATTQAQRLSGVLLDVDTGEPLGFGILTLRTPAGERLLSVVSDSVGRWRIDLPGPGTYHVEAVRIGYQTWVAGPLTLNAGDDISSTFQLARRPLALPAIEVSVAALRRHLETAGFYERQQANFGYFLTPEAIAERQARTLTDLLLAVPGVRLTTSTTGSVGARYVQLRGSNLSRGGICRPRVFVDGLLYARGDARPVGRTRDNETQTELQTEIMQRVDQGLSLDDIGPPGDIAGIEVYRSASQVPVQFGGTSVETLCGVIAIWTRRGVGR